jgi:plasmid stabilization system protein ParE
MTTATRRILPAADVDIDTQVLFLARKDERLAIRFFQAVQRTIDTLVDMPGMGSPVRLFNLANREIRKWPVAGFPEVLVFYVEQPNGVEVVRVLNSRQNWWKLLDFS